MYHQALLELTSQTKTVEETKAVRASFRRVRNDIAPEQACVLRMTLLLRLSMQRSAENGHEHDRDRNDHKVRGSQP